MRACHYGAREFFRRRSTKNCARPTAQTPGESGGFLVRVSTQELALLTRQFATLARAGLTLIECLGTLIEQMENARLKRVLTHVRQQVREGRSLADALQAHPRLFSSMYVNMIRAGEESGTHGNRACAAG